LAVKVFKPPVARSKECVAKSIVCSRYADQVEDSEGNEGVVEEDDDGDIGVITGIE